MTDETVVQQHSQNFATLKLAFEHGNVALMECLEISSGEKVAVICAAVKESDGSVAFTPFARFFNGNPYEMLRPPNPDGGFHDPSSQPAPAGPTGS